MIIGDEEVDGGRRYGSDTEADGGRRRGRNPGKLPEILIRSIEALIRGDKGGARDRDSAGVMTASSFRSLFAMVPGSFMIMIMAAEPVQPGYPGPVTCRRQASLRSQPLLSGQLRGVYPGFRAQFPKDVPAAAFRGPKIRVRCLCQAASPVSR